MPKNESASVGTIPDSAHSNGELNESTPPEQRAPKSSVPKSAGPKLTDVGGFAPATYDQTISHPIHGEQTLTRTDR